MEQKDIKKLPLRLLLNAEPFGFGPTAAIAGFFPHLRPHFDTVGYLGKNHTLDLQKGLPYDAIHDVTDTPKNERAEIYQSILSHYDVLFTAMDHKVAEEAQKAGLKVFYYDALTWYWPEIPSSVQKSDLYMAQDFFGVQERLRDVFAKHAAAYTVPPITPEVDCDRVRDHVLINLGGLQNPYWPIDEIEDYARSVVRTLRKVIPSSQKIVIAGSAAIAEKLKEEGVRTYARADMEDMLSRSKLAFMTSGLGNIFDAAAYNIPTVWLPPANDSQGKQLALLNTNGMSDASLDWAVILPDSNINYDADQLSILVQIAGMAKQLANDPVAQERLAQSAEAHYKSISDKPNSVTTNIIDRFGKGGEQKVASLVIDHAKKYCHG